ncbi:MULTISPECIES: type II toxin-antitoxin system RelE/ParE family toxin [Bifidobacterium]|uniref:Type II toxin-antitoxin system YafQ family toxin n=1 Tax=Bifidobacterium asteroides TaxID=1684 RepID=A0A0F4M056_9BIFI|nr:MULTISPECIES: type II toxin-antitoxin system YafQ family toxin [Bifidobacterium]KJY63923.1 Toxin-antitoxin system, toxin component [Bifidobacterium asteroides]MBI0086518.1 type II toxin-antitoxin system YafQ family toxin [Bifidobacterium sp. M0404]MCT8157423.1 type II toxin-antitoxin system YafQ family toxin [Bifidobacterium polysaccharolyticum]MDT7507954.1 type II toxin-antitoxin system YafQ family toxin [Bifidobacterium sp. H6bp22N]TSJ85765.1 type II toxin-antitoxin system YafQ family tox
MRLALVPTGAFARDLKRMARKHVPLEPVEEVLDLIAENSEASLRTLEARHRMHILQGYAAVYECHIGNAGDLLLVWHREGDAAYILRLGSHDQVLGRRGRY